MKIELLFGTGWKELTDEHGAFVLKDAPTGACELLISRKGFLPKRITIAADITTVPD